jgi:2-(1,2-epoxy-1,2-dihydrophenyl)acetyl-CoA isomerase
MSDEIIYEVDSGVATITLNRPQKLNATTASMLLLLQEAVGAAAEADHVRAVLVTGAGRGFCAGQDLGDRQVAGDASTPPDLAESLDTLYNPIVRAITTMPKPVVCGVNGVAAGAGANLALACDIVIAARSAKFVEVFSRIGLIPDAGGTWVLPRLIGRARAMGTALLAEPIPAEQAREWGLIWDVVDDDALGERARSVAMELAQGPTRGYGYIKRAFLAATAPSLDVHLDLERDLQGEAGRSADYREGVDAFFEKRDPRFEGR